MPEDFEIRLTRVWVPSRTNVAGASDSLIPTWAGGSISGWTAAHLGRYIYSTCCSVTAPEPDENNSASEA
jgi:hypothetical protein